ncbi:MAG: hypothetical protein ABIE94_07285 [archaeon]
MKRTLITTMVLLLAAGAASAAPKIMEKYSGIFSEGEEPRTRIQLAGVGLPYNFDFFAVRENCDDATLVKFRGQMLPFSFGDLSAGAAVQHVEPPVGEPKNDAGIVLRYSARSEGGTSLKADTRYFPTSNTLDGTVLFGSASISGDGIWSYDPESQTAMGRGFLGYNVTDNISAGLEIKAQGKISDMDVLYWGPRVSVSLP